MASFPRVVPSNIYAYNRLAPYGFESAQNIDADHTSGLVHPSSEHGSSHGATSLEQYSLAHHAEQLHAYEDSIASSHIPEHHAVSSADGLGGDVHDGQQLPPAKSLAPPTIKPGGKGKPPEEEETAITSLQKLRYSSRDQKDGAGGIEVGLHDISAVGDGSGVPKLDMNAAVAQLGADAQSLIDSSLRGVDDDTPGVLWKCPKCGKLCKTKSSMNTHINRKHADTKDNACPHCRKSYAIKDSLTKHIARKHSTLAKTFVCNQYGCNKSFPTLKERQDHFSRHQKQKPYACEFPNCQCSYTTKNSLNLHVARNHKEPRFTCAHCGEKYAVRGDLNQHERRKHGITTSGTGEDKLSDGELLEGAVHISAGGDGVVINAHHLEHITAMTSEMQAQAQQYHNSGAGYTHNADMSMTEYNVDNAHLMLQGGDPEDKQKEEGFEPPVQSGIQG